MTEGGATRGNVKYVFTITTRIFVRQGREDKNTGTHPYLKNYYPNGK